MYFLQLTNSQFLLFFIKPDECLLIVVSSRLNEDLPFVQSPAIISY
jgi:hypothetical protein